MESTYQKRSPGSLILEVLIVLFTGILILSIYYPKRLWDQQLREEELCRSHLENINYAAILYHRTTGRHTIDLDELMAFTEQESISVYPPTFKVDRLTREDAGIDSYQVEYSDPYVFFSHYHRRMKIERPSEEGASENSLVVYPEPLPQYPFAPISRIVFSSSLPITAMVDDRGVQGCFVLVGAQGRVEYRIIPGDTVRVRSKEYIFNIEPHNLTLCPSSHQRYRTQLNVKLVQEAIIEMEEESRLPSSSVADNPLLISNAVYRLLRDADASAKAIITREKVFEAIEDSLLEIAYQGFLDSTAQVLKGQGRTALARAIYDSTLEEKALTLEDKGDWEKIRDAVYERLQILRSDSSFAQTRDNLANRRKALIMEQEFARRLTELKQIKKTSIVESGNVVTVADSVEFYSQPSLIRDRLLKVKSDSVTVAHLNRPEVQELFKRFRYNETYRVLKVDTIGITIACPIEGEYFKPNRTLLDRIYSVGGTKNHGYVENGDLSWSETR